MAIGLHGDGINHNRKFYDSPTHDQCSNTKMLLKRRSEGDEVAYNRP